MNEQSIISPLPTLAILGGTGKEGPGLAMRLAIAGYPIIIGSRQEAKAKATATELMAQLGTGNIHGMENSAAARQAEICILTVVASAHQEAIETLKEDLRGKILVDATARVDFRNPKPPAAPSAARLAQHHLGKEVRVVAAFQNIPAHSLRLNLGSLLKSTVLVCADDMDAAETVIQIARSGGMSAYYAGDLDNAVVVEGLTALLISMNQHYKVKTASIEVSGIEK